MNARWKLSDDQRVVLIPGAMWVAGWIPASTGLIPAEYIVAWAAVCIVTGAILKRRLRARREAASRGGAFSGLPSDPKQ